MKQRLLALTTIAALTASMTIVGCSKQDQADVKNATNSTVAKADQKTRELGNDAARGMDKAKVETREAAHDATAATKSAVDKMGDKVEDAVITTSVKADLAKDKELSALRIDVDTSNGRVALKGTAPSEEARTHATQLASSVKGVVGVDNQLTVDAKK